MNKNVRVVLTIGVSIAGAAALIFAYREMREERDREAVAEAPVVPPSRVERDAAGGPVLRLDEPTEQLLGLQTSVPQPGTVNMEMTVPARVLDGSSLTPLVNEWRSAQSALAATRADFERKKTLFENGRNATAGAVEQARASMQQEENLVETARARIVGQWGGAIGAREDLPEFARRMLARELAVVRVDLPLADQPRTAPSTMRLLQPFGDALATAVVIGPAPAAEAVVASAGLLCLVQTNASALIPGSILPALMEAGVTGQGLVLPHAAVVRYAGSGWAYVQTAPHTFSRRLVPLELRHPDGWLVRGDWSQPVVVAGAQSLLSEELKGSIQMKD